jgi:hypothetical protein
MVPPLVTKLTLSVRVAVWIREPGSGPPTHARANSEPSPTEGPYCRRTHECVRTCVCVCVCVWGGCIRILYFGIRLETFWLLLYLTQLNLCPPVEETKRNIYSLTPWKIYSRLVNYTHESYCGVSHLGCPRFEPQSYDRLYFHDFPQHLQTTR